MPRRATQQGAYESGPVDDFATGPDPAYAARRDEGAWSDTPNAAWAPGALSYRTLGTEQEPPATRPSNGPPNESYRRRDADDRERHSVEHLDADGYEILKGYKSQAPNPRSVPPPEDRPTMRLAPRNFLFTRPFDVLSARRLNGTHFSMADHRRNYEVGGMAPVHTRRNTYRLEPVPWDENVVDLPPDVEPNVANRRIVAIDLPPATNRSWRL